MFIGKPHHTAVSLTGGQRKEEEKRVIVGSVCIIEVCLLFPIALIDGSFATNLSEMTWILKKKLSSQLSFAKIGGVRAASRGQRRGLPVAWISSGTGAKGGG